MSVAELLSETSANDSPSRSTSVTVIEPRPGWQAVNFREMWAYRELIYFLTWRDVKVRYKQTVMGGAWAVLQPLMTSLMFVVLFGKMANFSAGTSVPYLALVFAGQMAWQLFQASVVQGGQSLVSSSNLISKVYFPRLIVPIAAVGVSLMDFCLSLCVMTAILIAYGILPPLQVVLLPIMLGGVVMTAIGVGSLISALMVAYRDFRYVVPFLMQMWMLATPVGYPLFKIENLFRNAGLSSTGFFLPYFFLNPLAGFVQGFRWCLLNEPLDIRCLLASFASGALLLVIGAVYFRRVERRFADIV